MRTAGYSWLVEKYNSTMGNMPCSTAWPVHLGMCFLRQLYEAAWGEEYLHGTNSVENTIWRLRKKLEEDPRHPIYIKTVFRSGYKIVSGDY